MQQQATPNGKKGKISRLKILDYGKLHPRKKNSRSLGQATGGLKGQKYTGHSSLSMSHVNKVRAISNDNKIRKGYTLK